MATFRSLCEELEYWDTKKTTSGEKASEVVLRGLEIRPDREDTFWDDFINVIGGNSDSASELFGVSPSIISQWPAKIKKILDNVREKNKNTDMSRTG